MAQKLLLIDGSNLVHRGYHALPPLSTSTGQPSGAVYGLAQMLWALLESEKPDQVLMAFDPPGPTFRDELDANYKATRAEMDPELGAQMDLARDLARALGMVTVEVPGYEADDVIGTAAARGAAAGAEVLIVSGDRDLLQLVGPNVKVLAPVKGVKDTKLHDEASIREEYGVAPAQLVDVKALAGDTSDNIPGVPGIGPVGAAQLIGEFGDLETLLSRLSEVKRESLRSKLQEHMELARLSRELGRICLETPLPEAAADLGWHGADSPAARSLFARLEFGGLLERTGAWGSDWQGEVAVAGDADLEELCRAARAAGHLTVVPADNGSDAVLGLATGTERALIWKLPQAQTEPQGGLFDEEPAAEVAACLREVLENPGLPKWGCRLKEAARLLRALEMDCQGLDFDAEVADYVLNPSRTDHGVLLGAAREFGWWVAEDAEARAGAPAWQARAAVEALAVEGLRDAALQELAAAGLGSIFADVEMPLVRVLAAMEQRGITVDLAQLRGMGAQLSEALAGIATRAYELAGAEFNLDSPKQIGEVLFERLKLPKGKKTKTGWSTGAEVLEELAEEHEICARILEHRELAKLRSTYVEALDRIADPVTHRVHTTFEQTVTATGRLSSRNPNLQNIPVRTELGREIRGCFVAPAGMSLVKADYSQIELRLLAHFCHDENLTDAFRDGDDVHARTAALIFNVEQGAVTGDMRRVAKTVNFAVLYGMGSTALAKQLGIKRPEAQEFIDGYFTRLASVREYLDAVVAGGRELGYVSTLLGRRRYMPELHSPDRGVAAYAERAAMNTPLQGSAADIVKVAMVKLANLLPQQFPQAALLLQVHDELVLEAPTDQAAAVGALVKDVMEGVVVLDVPLVVEVACGPNWRDVRAL